MWETTGTNIYRRADGLQITITIPSASPDTLGFILSIPQILGEPGRVVALSAVSGDGAMEEVDAAYPLPEWWTS
jgi:hypothetical protein